MHERKFYRLGEAQSIEKCLPRGTNGFTVIIHGMVFMGDLGFLEFFKNLKIMIFCLTLRRPFYLLNSYWFFCEKFREMGGAGCIAFRGWLKLLNSFCC